MNVNEARALQEAAEANAALQLRVEKLEAVLTAMIPKGPGRKPEWVRVLTNATD